MQYLKVKQINSSGISIIEMLVVMVILAIIVGIGYTNFRNQSQRQALSSAVRQIDGDLKLAREYALSGKKPTSAVCEQLDGYWWKKQSGLNSYDVYADCTNDEIISIGKDGITLPLGISLSVVDSSGPTDDEAVMFKVLGQGTQGGTFNIIVTHTGLGIGKTLSY